MTRSDPALPLETAGIPVPGRIRACPGKAGVVFHPRESRDPGRGVQGLAKERSPPRVRLEEWSS